MGKSSLKIDRYGPLVMSGFSFLRVVSGDYGNPEPPYFFPSIEVQQIKVTEIKKRSDLTDAADRSKQRELG